MKKIPVFPRSISWLSAVLLYMFLGVWVTFASAVLPRLIEIGEEHPRLAILGYLGVWVSPIPLVATLHHVVHLFLDRADRTAKETRRVLPGIMSVWAGVYAWLVILFASSVAMFLLVLLNPPEPHDGLSIVAILPRAPSLLFTVAGALSGAPVGLHSAVWVSVAAQLYQLERAVRQHTSESREL